MDLEEHPSTRSATGARSAGQTHPAEIEAAMESGGPALCTVHADEVVPRRRRGRSSSGESGRAAAQPPIVSTMLPSLPPGGEVVVRRHRLPRAGYVAAISTRTAPDASSGRTERSIARAVNAFSSSGRARSVEPWIRAGACHSQPKVQLGLRAGADPDHRDPAPQVQRVEVTRQVGRADQLEDHVERPVLLEALGRDDRPHRAPRPRRGSRGCGRSR